MRPGDLLSPGTLSVATYGEFNRKSRQPSPLITWTTRTIGMLLCIDGHWIQLLIPGLGVRWSHEWLWKETP